LDGPVVTAARQALDAGDVEVVLPFVSEQGEREVRAMFGTVLPAGFAGSSSVGSAPASILSGSHAIGYLTRRLFPHPSRRSRR
jgi:hypothetical protein